MARWNLPDFMAMKSGGFHEIQQISWQGLIYTAYLACNRLIHVYLYWFWWKIQDLVVDHESLHFYIPNEPIMYICIGSDEKYSIQW